MTKKIPIFLLAGCILFLIAQVILSVFFSEWEVRNGNANMWWSILLWFSVCYILVYLIVISRIGTTVKWTISILVLTVCGVAGCASVHPLDTTTEPYDIEVLKEGPDGEKIVVREYKNAKTNRIIKDTIQAYDVFLFRKLVKL